MGGVLHGVGEDEGALLGVVEGVVAIGAGIVAGSTPEGEWAEIEQKIGDFTRVFGLGPRHGSA